MDRGLEIAESGNCEEASIGLVNEAYGRWYLKKGEPVVAGAHLAAAMDAVERVGNEHMVGRFRVVYAETLSAAGATAEAIGEYEIALTELDLEKEPAWGYVVSMHLVHRHLERHDLNAARRYLRSAESSVDGIARREDLLRIEWTRAMIDSEECKFDRAATALEGVRDGFADLGRPYEAALAALEAAALHAENGDVHLLRVLAAESYELFAAMGIAPNALAAFAALRVGNGITAVQAAKAAVASTKAAWQAATAHQAARVR